MTKKEVNRRIKLIADFMGEEVELIKGHWRYKVNGRIVPCNTDYNCLMEVVEKIESLEIAFIINGKESYISTNAEDIIVNIGDTKIESVFLTVSDYAEFYIEVKKSIKKL